MSGNKLIFKIILGTVVVVVLFFGYRWLRSPGEELPPGPGGLQPVGFLDGSAEIEPSDEFLALLLSLQSISLASDIYPALREFQDFSTELAPQTPGRENPFAPIGRGGRPATTTAGSAVTASPSGQSQTAGAAAAPSSNLSDFLNN